MELSYHRVAAAAGGRAAAPSMLDGQTNLIKCARFVCLTPSHLCRHCVVGPLRTPSMLNEQTNLKKCTQLVCLSPSQKEEQWYIQSKWREEVRNGGKISLAAARSHTKIKVRRRRRRRRPCHYLIGRPTTDAMPSM